MKAAWVAGLACLVAWVASPATAGEPRIGKFVQYDAGEFVIVTSRSPAQAQRLAEDLVKFRVAMEKLLSIKATPNIFPTTIVISSSADWRNWLQPREEVAGFFHRARFANYMCINGDAPIGEALHVTFHEYTHYFQASRFASEFPPWFNEGLAELMGWAKFDKNTAVLRIPMDLVYEARDGDWISFDRMLRIDHSDPEYQSHQLAQSFYAQAWLTVNYGMLENREFGRNVFKYLAALNRLVPQQKAATDAFGDLAAVDNQLRSFSRSRNIASGALALGETPAVNLGAPKPLSEFDSAATFANLMLDSRFSPERIRPLVESLGRRDPNAARAAILAARLALVSDDNAAFDAAVAKAEAALAPGDWEQRRELASVLLASGSESGVMSSRKSEDMNRDVERAFKWFSAALNHNSDDVEALWGFGTAATRLGKNLDVAELALLNAYRDMPSSPEIAMSLAHLQMQQDKPDAAIPFLEDTQRLAMDLQTRRWATDTLKQTRDFIAERDRLQAESRRQQAAYEKARDEYDKKHAKSSAKK
jgi:tetratricopeptide (TPR) repeat protein